MQDYQRRFIEFALDCQVLRFGDFTLKSGRRSPYFFNAGLFNTGARLAALGRAYAETIVNSGIGFDVLFGPAYKGIPLVAAVAYALAEGHGRDLPYCYNRKEAKDHGEGGSLVGAPLAGRVLIVDDVITAGTAIREALGLIRGQGATPAGIVVSLDRQERGQGETSAIQELQQTEGLSVAAIVRLAELVEFIQDDPENAGYLPAIQAYRDQYGVA